MFLEMLRTFKRRSPPAESPTNLQPAVSPLLNTRFIDQQRQRVRLKVPEGKPDPLDVVKAKFPRIYKAIVVQWGTRELHEQFKKWILCSRESRQGWPMDVGQAILALSKEHNEQFKFEDTNARRYKKGAFVWE